MKIDWGLIIFTACFAFLFYLFYHGVVEPEMQPMKNCCYTRPDWLGSADCGIHMKVCAPFYDGRCFYNGENYSMCRYYLTQWELVK